MFHYRHLLPACFLVTAVLTAPQSDAADKYWDTSTNAGLQAGNGNWTDTSWSSVPAGSDPLAAWVDNDSAFFQTGGGNDIILNGTVIANAVTQSGAGTLTTISSGGVLRLDTNAGITNSGDSALTIHSTVQLNSSNVAFAGTGNTVLNGGISEINGPRNITKSGAGTLSVTAASSYTGTTTISGGTLLISHADALGTSGGGTVVSSGGTLALSGGISVNAAETLNISGSGFGSTGALRNESGDNIWNGSITANTGALVRIISGDSAGSLTINGNIATTSGTERLVLEGTGTGTINGVISGSGNILRSANNAGLWTLTGANTYTGSTAIGNGAISVSHIGNGNFGPNATLSSNLGAQTTALLATVRLSGTGTLIYTGAGETTTRNFRLDGGSGGIEATGNTGALVIEGDVTASDATGTRTLVLKGSSTLDNTLAGDIISANIGVTKEGGGTWMLSGTNLYDGTTLIKAGQLIVTNDNALGSSTGGTVIEGTGALHFQGDLEFNDTLALSGSGDTIKLQSVSGNQVWNGNVTADVGNFIRISAGTSASTGLNIKGDITTTGGSSLVLQGTNGRIEGDISGSAGVIRSNNDSGTWTLTGNNTYSGPTLVSNGTLLINNIAGSGTGSGTVTVSSIGTLGGTGRIAGNTIVSAGGVLSPGDFTLSGNTTATLTLDANLQMHALSSVNIGIGGTADGEWDRIAGVNDLTLGGTWNVSAVDGFNTTSLVAGAVFEVLSWEGLTNAPVLGTDYSFNFAGAQLDDGLFWDSYIENNALHIRVNAVPEPSRLLLLMGAAWCLLLRRRK